jgi:transposase, IS5 family
VKKGKLLRKARKALRAEYGEGFPEVRATRGHPLTKEDKELNRFLAKVRAPVEHPFATIKRVFHCERVLATTLGRAKVRLTFVCTCYNLFRALGLASVKGP